MISLEFINELTIYSFDTKTNRARLYLFNYSPWKVGIVLSWLTVPRKSIDGLLLQISQPIIPGLPLRAPGLPGGLSK